MNVVRIASAPAYRAAGHALVAMRRLQGREAGPSESLWLGLSRVAPGGGTALSSSASETFHVVWSGQVTVSNGAEAVTLGPLDAVRIAPGEARQISDRTDEEAVVLPVMAERASPAPSP